MMLIFYWVAGFFSIVGFIFSILLSYAIVKDVYDMYRSKKERLNRILKSGDRSKTTKEFKQDAKKAIFEIEQIIVKEGYPYCNFKKGLFEDDIALEKIAYWLGQNDIEYEKRFIHYSDHVSDKEEVFEGWRYEFGCIYGFKRKEDLAHFILKWMEKCNYETT